MRIVNFAQGELLMLGMFASFYLVTGGGSWPSWVRTGGPFVGAICAGPMIFIGGALLHKFLISPRVRPAHGRLARRRPFRPAHRHPRHLADPPERRADRVRLHAGGRAHAAVLPGLSARPRLRRRHRLPEQGQAGRLRGRDRWPRWCCTSSLEYTRLGKALRAAADNPTAATYMGIDVDRSYRIAFGLGCGITAVAGGLMATYISFGPFVGFDYVIIMYSGVVLGGMGSIFGRVLGRADRGLRAAVLGPDPAAAAAERGDLRRVPDDRAAAAARSRSAARRSGHETGRRPAAAAAPDGARRGVRSSTW